MMTSISDALRDAGASSVFWLGLGIVLIIAIVGFVLSRARAGSASVGEAGKVVHDWTPTGRIDFAGPPMAAADTPAFYYLQAEDIRLLVSFSGIERKEIRWRRATLNEAKRVVTIFHRQMTKAADRPTEGDSLGAVSSGEGLMQDAAKGDG